MIVDPGSGGGLERSLYLEGIYEAGTLDVLRRILRTGDTFLDVGANIGLMTLAASRWAGRDGRVYAFEPVPETYDLLRRNLEINGSANVHARCLALGSTSGTARVYERPEVNRGAASLVRPENPTRDHRVEVGTLDEFLHGEGVEDVRAVKADVEGWELEVLRGGRRLFSRVGAPILIIECSRNQPMRGGSPPDLFRFIGSMNDYRVFRLEGGKSSVSRLIEIQNVGELSEHDNLFCFLPSHLHLLEGRLALE
jgi:FkbM family methyltransferase